MKEFTAININQKLLYQSFEDSISKGESNMVETNDYMRSIGKTYLLEYLAEKYDLPIITPCQTIIYPISKIREKLQAYSIDSDLKGRGLDTVLIDSGIPEQLLHEKVIPYCENIIGFTYKYSV